MDKNLFICCHRRQNEMNKRELGSKYEQAVGYYLEQQGYEVLEYNYRCRFGEIDLIARDGEYLVFCEVKFRKSLRAGSSLEAVDERKQKTIYLVAQHYLMMHHLDDIPCRFDVIGVEHNKVIVMKNAFEG